MAAGPSPAAMIGPSVCGMWTAASCCSVFPRRVGTATAALSARAGNLVPTTSSPGRVQLWRAPTSETRGHELQHLVFAADGNEQAITTSAAFSPDGKFLAVGTKGGNLIVWPMPTKEEI